MVEVNELLNTWLLIAKEDRARYSYSAEEAFVPKVAIIGPNDESFVAIAGWRDEQQKYAMMRAAAEMARQLFAQAIVLASDVRWVRSDAFSEHFKIEPPTSLTRENVETYQKKYLAILREHGGQVKHLPRQLWKEAVMIAIKGPRCGTHALMAPYDQGPNDTVHFLPCEKNPEDHRYQMNLIPEWWH
jgi:hypothetical protein